MSVNSNGEPAASDTTIVGMVLGVQLLRKALAHIHNQLKRHGALAYSRALRSCVDAATAAQDEHDRCGCCWDIVSLTRRPLASLVLAQLSLLALAATGSEQTPLEAEAEAWRSSHARKLLLLRCCLLYSPRAPSRPKVELSTAQTTDLANSQSDEGMGTEPDHVGDRAYAAHNRDVTLKNKSFPG